jgi:hypothetical protein
MKVTNEMLSRKDYRDDVIDFAFCFRCYHFLDLSDYLPGDNVKCLHCYTDQFLDINGKRYCLYLPDDNK